MDKSLLSPFDYGKHFNQAHGGTVPLHELLVENETGIEVITPSSQHSNENISFFSMLSWISTSMSTVVATSLAVSSFLVFDLTAKPISSEG